MAAATTHGDPEALPETSRSKVLSMRNAVTGWRLHVGLMFPTPAPIRAIREWYEVVPDGVDITPLSLTIRQLTDDNMEMAVKGMEHAAELLSHYDVNMIFQSGVPPIVAPEKPNCRGSSKPDCSGIRIACNHGHGSGDRGHEDVQH